jgi:uncharacterized membrane protein (UPF0136 family)
VRRSSVELAGEFLRETGVFVFVFYGLAAALLATTHEIPLSTAFIGTAMGLIFVGLRCSRGEKEKGMKGWYAQLASVALGGLIVFAFALYSIHREKKRS